ncbi:MAG: DUF1549 domain-containing protein [Gemmataceae bacterium]
MLPRSMRAGCAMLILAGVCAGEARSQRFRPQPQGPEAPAAPKSALLTFEDWQRAPLTPLKKGEIDQLVSQELTKNKIQPAPLTTDEQFIRRATLDLTGALPLPADVTEFVASKETDKRAKLIDKLLESDEYARHWSRYWRDVVTNRLAERRALLFVRPFEQWLYTEIKANKSWGEMARAMIAADGAIRSDEVDKNGAAFFLASRRGTDAVNERAAETARVFLGIQIQCAQCHDHPFDQWRRVQFHEFAAYFARTGERLVRDGNRQLGVELVGRRFGEHQMPAGDEPRKTFTTHPRYLDGTSPGKNLDDVARRKALADQIVDQKNYWFAAAYVNRMWGSLIGQSFYEPVDDMGPQKGVVFPMVLTRLTGSFRASNYDMKGLFRDIMNSQAYQRQIRLGESPNDHLHFAGAYPTRLSADAIWDSLEQVLGPLSAGRGGPPRGGFGGFRFGIEGQFKAEFAFDPSLKADDVEGSIPQALFLMNNAAINQKLRADGDNLLGRILKAYPKDEDALRMVYLRTLARQPTARELARCQQYIKDTAERGEAFEDILWALINSTEFQSKR